MCPGPVTPLTPRRIDWGVLATGRVGVTYSQNAKRRSAYHRLIDQSQIPVVRGLALSCDGSDPPRCDHGHHVSRAHAFLIHQPGLADWFQILFQIRNVTLADAAIPKVIGAV